jgi:hypothetical protein
VAFSNNSGFEQRMLEKTCNVTLQILEKLRKRKKKEEPFKQ